MVVRPATTDDANEILRIYNYYVQSTVATFEEEDVTLKEMERRIKRTLDRGLPWLVSAEDKEITGNI